MFVTPMSSAILRKAHILRIKQTSGSIFIDNLAQSEGCTHVSEPFARVVDLNWITVRH